MKTINTKNAPAALGPYSQGINIRNTLYTSGMLGIDPSTNTLKTTIEEQANQAFKNIKAIIEEANFDMKDVIKTTVFLSDLTNFSKVNEIYEKYFISNPCRSCVEVKALPKNALIEIEAICVKL